MTDWNPDLYKRFQRYRAEPVLEILGRLELGPDERIIDLGCGSGENTVELARRTERGQVFGIDSSPAMIEAAIKLRESLDPGLRGRICFAPGDIHNFRADHEYSVVFSNAALQWVPNHQAIFKRCFDALVPRGRLAMQIPANEDETAKLALTRLIREEPWKGMLSGLHEPLPWVPPAEHYRQLLGIAGFVEVDCYYRTFRHPMDNPGEVVEFYRSTALRPVLLALPSEAHPGFLAAFTQRLKQAYATAGPLVFPFRRLFLWGKRSAN